MSTASVTSSGIPSAAATATSRAANTSPRTAAHSASAAAGADGTGTAVARSTVPPDGTTMPHVSDVIVGAATVTVYEPITGSMPGSSVATNQTPGWPGLVTNTPFSSVAATTGSKKMVTGGSADAFLACLTLARNVTVAPGIGAPSGDSSPSEPSNTARIRRPVTRPYWTPLGILMVYS